MMLADSVIGKMLNRLRETEESAILPGIEEQQPWGIRYQGSGDHGGSLGGYAGGKRGAVCGRV